MKKLRVILIGFLFLLGPSSMVAAAPSLMGAEVQRAVTDLGAKSRITIIEAVKALAIANDAAALPALQALADRRLRATEDGRVILLGEDDASATDAINGDTVDVQGMSLRTPIINNAVRRVLLPLIAQLQLQSPDVSVRLSAAEELSKHPQEESAHIIRAARDKESDSAVRGLLTVTMAQIDLNSRNVERQLKAIVKLGDAGNLSFKSILQEFVRKDDQGNFIEPNEKLRTAAAAALDQIETRQFFITQGSNFFYGLSLGSILLLAALGLAITFGLMGVINMAHGEMLMLGAYATYVVQNLFKQYLPNWFDWYLLAALPVAFVVSGAVGMVLERSIIRHLYGRPLETLLATWGISLFLIQSVRLLFGAQNVEVANPSWLSGGWEVVQGVVLPYNRIAIVVFVVIVVTLVWTLLQRTRLGLQVRAVTQDRPMAAAMGISTARVDMWTFGLGSGVAGLGGVALSQIGNVGPELGQSYIVDSFMVVVLGGVGKLAGTVVGAMGLGMVNKFLEPFSGAVLGKIMVLLFIILFIQKRPQGIFALKGRTA